MPSVDTVRKACEKYESEGVTFTDDALEQLTSVPRLVLGIVVKGCVKWAKEHEVATITAKEIEQINAERKQKK